MKTPHSALGKVDRKKDASVVGKRVRKEELVRQTVFGHAIKKGRNERLTSTMSRPFSHIGELLVGY